MNIPDDVDELCSTLMRLGVDFDLVQKAKSILSSHTNKVEYWIELAAALRKRGEYHPSLATYEYALQRFPNSHQLWNNKGGLLREWRRHIIQTKIVLIAIQ